MCLLVQRDEISNIFQCEKYGENFTWQYCCKITRSQLFLIKDDEISAVVSRRRCYV